MTTMDHNGVAFDCNGHIGDILGLMFTVTVMVSIV